MCTAQSEAWLLGHYSVILINDVQEVPAVYVLRETVPVPCQIWQTL